MNIIKPNNTFHTYIIFRCSPRGFSSTCLQQMQGSVVEGLGQTATSGSQCFFLSEKSYMELQNFKIQHSDKSETKDYNDKKVLQLSNRHF